MDKVIIVGGGIIGLMTSYYLVKNGFNNITIIEKNYIGSGGTYRCATGIRASFTSREHIELMKRSIELWSILREELGIPYTRSGYIWLLQKEDEVKQFKKYVSFQNKYGVPTKIITPEEIKEKVPGIDTSHIIAGVFDPLAGKAHCFKAALYLYKYLIDNNVKIIDKTKVLRIKIVNNKVVGVDTNKGFIEGNKVVLAAGYGSKEVALNSGFKLPLENIPKHALVTERFRELFKPLLIDWSNSSYIVQVIAGNFLIGAEVPEKPDTPPLNKLEFLYRAASIWTRHFPWLREVNILRYWTGYYVMTPDHHPIIGPCTRVEGLYIATGFSGHGFMAAPASGENMAHWILYGKPKQSIVYNLSCDRFEKGKYIKEIAVFG